jgi:hypothetical protein
MPSSGRMALGLLFLTGCAARRFFLVFIRPRTASPNRPKPSALHKQGAVARLRLLSSGWREILPDDQVRDLATQLLDTHSLRAADSLRGPAIGQGRRISWILGSRTSKSRSLNEISCLVFSGSCNHRGSQRELAPLLFKDPVFLGAGPTTSILIRARSVVQVHPGPPFKSSINTRIFLLSPFQGISLTKRICQPFVNFTIGRVALHSGR